MSITYEEFSKLDIRVAKIITAERIKGYKKIVKAKIDLGNEERELVVGGAEYYQPEDLIGKVVIILANLQPRKIAGIESEGMLLAADVDDKPIWLTIDGDAPLGSRIR
jgi:tRNA-binding protein